MNFPLPNNENQILPVPKTEHPSLSAKLSKGLSWPPGFIGAVAEFIYNSSLRPVPEVAIVGAIGLMAGICGKAWNTPTGTGLNLYLILVARSAIGKESMHTGIAMLMNAATNDGDISSAKKFVDYTDFASGQALHKACANFPSFVTVTGELGYKLKQIAAPNIRADSPMQTLRRLITALYSKSGPQSIAGGIKYSDKDKNIPSVEGVAFSMIGETTPSTFYELITKDMMEDGFLSRFTIVEYEGERPPPNESAQQFSTPYPELVAYLKKLLVHSLTLIDRKHTQVVAYSTQAKITLDAFCEECDEQVRKAGDNESVRQMWNRAHLKALKLCSLLAAADNFVTPQILDSQAEWAIGLVRRDIAIFSKRLHEGDIGLGDDARQAKVIALLSDYLNSDLPKFAKHFSELKEVGIIPHNYLQIRTQKLAAFANHRNGSTKALTDTERALIDMGLLQEVSKLTLIADHKYFGRAFRILSTGEFKLTARGTWMKDFLDDAKKGT